MECRGHRVDAGGHGKPVEPGGGKQRQDAVAIGFEVAIFEHGAEVEFLPIQRIDQNDVGIHEKRIPNELIGQNFSGDGLKIELVAIKNTQSAI